MGIAVGRLQSSKPTIEEISDRHIYSMLTPITLPSTYPVTLAEAKVQVGTLYDDADTNNRLTDLIAKATAEIETYLRRALMPQTWELNLRYFPCGAIYLPKPVLTSVTHIKYYDMFETLQTLTPAEYRVYTPYYSKGFIEPVGSWPTSTCRADSVQIRFIAGYVTVPDEIKQAILLRVSDHNQYRESDTVPPMGSTIKNKIAAYTVEA